MIVDILPDTGTEIRVDGATAFQTLEIESQTNDSLLKSLGIKIIVGRLLNKNKNPIAENTVKEMQKEILRFKQRSGPITDTDLLVILKNINSRVRFNNLTPKEILFRRNTLTNQALQVNDEDVINKQSGNREKASESSIKFKSKYRKKSPIQHFKVGDLVMLRSHTKKK